MKIRHALVSATALGLLMGGAALANENRSVIKQTGDDNTVSVTQNGDNNVAGDAAGSAAAARELRQNGNDNAISITQTGYRNTIAGFSLAPGGHGAYQTGSFNQLTITQETRLTGHSSSGNIVDRIRQDSSAAATGTTNVATVTQTRGTLEVGQENLIAGHRVLRIDQTHLGGDPNTLTITQTGAYSTFFGGSWPASGQNNYVGYAVQNGSDNTATITQSGQGPQVFAGSAWQTRGPANTIERVDQSGAGHTAVVTQDGHQNYINEIRQSGADNTATVVLNGSYNGATANAGNGRPSLGVLGGSGVAAAAAAAADAQAGLAAGLTSSVEQVGSGNAVDYQVNGASGNQFGFWQYGAGNQAINITITGNDNHLGVYQSGNNNALALAAIGGAGNQLGLIQTGDDNVADVAITGDGNGGGLLAGAAATLAGANGLTSGMIRQDGNLNSATLTISNSSNNQFAFLQQGNANVIDGTVAGAGSNSAAVVQIGNSNATTFSQNGGGNVVSVTQ